LIAIDDFKDDSPWDDSTGALAELVIPDQIDGVRLNRLVTNSDGRGNLTVLGSDVYCPGFSSPHVYVVTASAGSVRAWVIHKRQSDRLAYTAGSLTVALFDIRPESPTYGQLNVLDVGANNPVLLTIPPLVVHGVVNRGDSDVQFINMPTRAYDSGHPDKSRLPYGHPGIPYSFE
jgi:dTDP-4-dehydrorhamnose 3,5-epimerase